MKTKFYGVALLALMLCSTGMLSYAQGPGEWGGGHGFGFGRMATALNLTPAQKQEIKSMMEAQRATTRPLMQQLSQIRISMLNATASGAFNQTTVQSLATQQAQIMAQLTVQRESFKSQIYNKVLTSEQKATADQLRQNEISQINQRLQASSQSSAPATAQ
ncbi:MAG: Spy/CpxP family protein refolding chaperone [Candidatus Korobacteraceae bacterium]